MLFWSLTIHPYRNHTHDSQNINFYDSIEPKARESESEFQRPIQTAQPSSPISAKLGMFGLFSGRKENGFSRLESPSPPKKSEVNISPRPKTLAPGLKISRGFVNLPRKETPLIKLEHPEKREMRIVLKKGATWDAKLVRRPKNTRFLENCPSFDA